MKPPFSDDDHEALTLWVGATRYYLGRMTYAVSDYCQMLIKHWPQLPRGTQFIITRDIDEAFAKDDADRARGQEFRGYGALGMDTDRASWEQVRALWSQPHDQA